MAIIKINRSQARINPIETPRVSGLAIDPNIMVNYGNAIASVGKVVEDAKAKTQKTQDTNDARELLNEAKKTVMLEANQYQKSTDVSVIDNFYDAVHADKFKPLLKGYNKQVQNLFITELYKVTNKVGTDLFGSVLQEHGKLTINNKKKELFEYDVMASANDPRERDKADKLKKLFYNNPENISVFGENGLNELKEESTLRTLSLRYKLNTKNDPMSVLMLGQENIANDVANEGLAKQIYDNAGKALISKAVQERKIEDLQIKFNKDQKMSNFAYVISKFQSDTDSVTLDDINDLYKKDALNSSQRDALYNIYTKQTDLSDQNVIDIIEGALLIADSVEDIDILKEQVLMDRDYVLGLGITDFSKYETLFNKYQKNLPAFKEYQTNKKLLKADLGKIEATGGSILSFLEASASAARDPKQTIIATDYYDALVMDGTTPADAYLQTTERFLRGSNISSIKDFTALSSIRLNEPTDDEVKNPSKYTENRTNELVALYKKGSIDITAFSNDLAALDSVAQLIKLRTDLGETDVFGFGEATVKLEEKPKPK